MTASMMQRRLRHRAERHGIRELARAVYGCDVAIRFDPLRELHVLSRRGDARELMAKRTLHGLRRALDVARFGLS